VVEYSNVLHVSIKMLKIMQLGENKALKTSLSKPAKMPST